MIQALIDSGSIDVREQEAIDMPPSLGKGERTVIALFHQIGVDYLISCMEAPGESALIKVDAGFQRESCHGEIIPVDQN